MTANVDSHWLCDQLKLGGRYGQTIAESPLTAACVVDEQRAGGIPISRFYPGTHGVHVSASVKCVVMSWLRRRIRKRKRS